MYSWNNLNEIRIDLEYNKIHNCQKDEDKLIIWEEINDTNYECYTWKPSHWMFDQTGWCKMVP